MASRVTSARTGRTAIAASYGTVGAYGAHDFGPGRSNNWAAVITMIYASDQSGGTRLCPGRGVYRPDEIVGAVVVLDHGRRSIPGGQRDAAN